MIIAYYSDGAESYASTESCASLKKDLPIITNVSNDSSKLDLGHCFLAWAKPVELDTVKFPGPFSISNLSCKMEFLDQIFKNYWKIIKGLKRHIIFR